jgi:hypothetical protein
MRYPKRHINAKQLKKLVSYDPVTGLFTRLVPSCGGRVPAGFVFRPKTWNQYQHIKIGGVQYTAHRLAWVLMTGKQPDFIDHINGLKHDNRFVNLRDVTASENMKNRTAHRKAEGRFVDHPDALLQEHY